MVNPDEVVDLYGADAVRTFEMFIGAFDQSTPWSEKGLKGCYKFLERVWNLQDMVTDGEELSKDMEMAVHKAIMKVSDDYEKMKYNTAIATLMSLVNDFYKKGSVTKGEYRILIILLNPNAPHITEELWEKYGNTALLATTRWPDYDKAKTVDDEVEIAVQINGKIKDKITVSKDISKEDLESAAKEAERIKEQLSGKTVVKVICVPGKLVNIVVK